MILIVFIYVNLIKLIISQSCNPKILFEEDFYNNTISKIKWENDVFANGCLGFATSDCGSYNGSFSLFMNCNGSRSATTKPIEIIDSKYDKIFLSYWAKCGDPNLPSCGYCADGVVYVFLIIGGVEFWINTFHRNSISTYFSHYISLSDYTNLKNFKFQIKWIQSQEFSYNISNWAIDNIKVIQQNLCSNRGSCVNDQCICFNHSHGKNCEHKACYLDSVKQRNHCNNHGTCTINPYYDNDYYMCICDDDYTEYDCKTELHHDCVEYNDDPIIIFSDNFQIIDNKEILDEKKWNETSNMIISNNCGRDNIMVSTYPDATRKLVSREIKIIKGKPSLFTLSFEYSTGYLCTENEMYTQNVTVFIQFESGDPFILLILPASSTPWTTYTSNFIITEKRKFRIVFQQNNINFTSKGEWGIDNLVLQTTYKCNPENGHCDPENGMCDCEEEYSGIRCMEYQTNNYSVDIDPFIIVIGVAIVLFIIIIILIISVLYERLTQKIKKEKKFKKYVKSLKKKKRLEIYNRSSDEVSSTESEDEYFTNTPGGSDNKPSAPQNTNIEEEKKKILPFAPTIGPVY